MFELWYGIVALMLVLYVVLDGYDLGAGALHLRVARTDAERRTVLAAIGPYWDANEVWLLVAGGTLFVAFPRVLASGFSGFYLGIFLLIWCLILRAVAIELRSHLREGLWRGFWDVVFTAASGLLAVLFGTSLGNVIRGVPLTSQGWFQLTLFTSFEPHAPVGILDWYTVLAGAFALVALMGHGAAFLAWRTEGSVHERSRLYARRLYLALAALWPVTTLATHAVNPQLLPAIPGRPFALLGVALAVGGVFGVLVWTSRRRHLAAFIASCAFVTGMLMATAACMFPVMLRSIGDPALSITARQAGATPSGLRAALGWWSIGFPLAVLYFVLLFRIHRGKAVAVPESEGP